MQGVKTGRSPLLAIVIILALLGGGMLALKARNDDSRRVVQFFAVWSPRSVKATQVKLGQQVAPERLPNKSPAFQETRSYPKGSVVALNVLISGGKDFYNLRCNIKVGNEAPKWGVVTGRQCNVVKYVS